MTFQGIELTLSYRNQMPFKIDFVLGDIEDLLKITNQKLENIETLLEFLLLPPELKDYKKGQEMKRKKLSDVEK